jgi:hypothetical protein
MEGDPLDFARRRGRQTREANGYPPLVLFWIYPHTRHPFDSSTSAVNTSLRVDVDAKGVFAVMPAKITLDN